MIVEKLQTLFEEFLLPTVGVGPIGSPPEDAKNYVIDHTNCMLRSAKPKLDPVYNIKFSHSLGNRKKPAVK